MPAAWCCGVLALLAASQAGPSSPTSVLVLEPKAEGVDGSIALQITSRIAEVVSSHPGHAVLTVMDVRDLLSHEETRQLVGCEDEAQCRAQISKLENVDLVISPSVGKVGRDLTITAALLEGRTAVVRGRVTRIAESRNKLPETVSEVIERLFGWQQAPPERVFSLPEGDEKSFAVLDLVPSGVDAAVVANLTQVLSSELGSVRGTSVIGRDDIKAMLAFEAEKQLVGCADDASCMAEIGAALGVDYIVAGHVGVIAGTYIIALRLIAPESMAVDNRVTESFVGVPEQLVGAMRHAGRRLLGVGLDEKGALAVRLPEAEGSVFLDGRETSDGPFADLPVGRHRLRVVKDGYLEWSSDVYVHPGAESTVVAGLRERPDRWYESWVFWTSVGGVVAIAAGTTVGLMLAGRDDPTNQPYPFQIEVGLPGR